MTSARAGNLLTHLSQVPDPRGRKGRRHPLAAMLTATVCGLLCGNRGYSAIVEWLHDLPVDVWHWMGYTRRPPKQDCFRDLLMKLDSAALEEALTEWITETLNVSTDAETLQAVSFDGKTLCGTLRPFSRAVHLLAAVDHQTGCVLSQCAVDEKTNEHKTAFDLLKTLVLENRVIVGDAMFCQRDLCETIVDSGGDYFVAVKENQPTLLREIQLEMAASDAAFSPSGPSMRRSDDDRAATLDKGHGRLERRTIVSSTALNQHVNWPHVKQVCKIVRKRTIRGEQTTEVVYYVTSLSRERASAETLLALARRHWGAIENGVHYVRDETLGEDRSTIVAGNSPQNFAALRNAGLSVLRQLKTANIGGHLTQLRAETPTPLRHLRLSELNVRPEVDSPRVFAKGMRSHALNAKIDLFPAEPRFLDQLELSRQAVPRTGPSNSNRPARTTIRHAPPTITALPTPDRTPRSSCGACCD